MTTSEISPLLLDPIAARELTDRIKVSIEGVWTLLLEAHERQAWRALGYVSWRAYATAEFDLSQSRAYELLDKARVIAALDEFDLGSDLSKLTARDVKALKPVLASVVEEVRSHVTTGVDPARALVLAVNKNQVERRRQKAARRRDRDRRARAALAEKERAAMARRVGGKPAAVYGHLRRLAQELDGAIDGANDRDVKAHLRSALAAIYVAEDAVVQALRLSAIADTE